MRTACLFLVLSTLAWADGLRYRRDLDAALAEAKAGERNVLVVVTWYG